MADAYAPNGDEGRGELRKASGSCKRALIRGFPNGATRQVEDLSSGIYCAFAGSDPSDARIQPFSGLEGGLAGIYRLGRVSVE